MFQIFSGTMGGGKTYYGVEVAIKTLKLGRRVMSNIDWVDPEIERRGWKDQIIKLGEDPLKWREMMIGADEGCENFMCIDEAAMIMHAWDQSKHDAWKRELFELIAHSRKLGIDLVVISQAASNLDAGLRKMAAFEIHCVAVKKIPVIGPWAAVLFGDFKRSVLNQRRQVLSSSYARYSSEVGTLYQTDALRGAALGIKRDAPSKKRDKIRSPLWLRVTATVVLLTVAWGSWHMYQSYQRTLHPSHTVLGNGGTGAKRVEPVHAVDAGPQPAGPGEVGEKTIGYEAASVAEHADEILQGSYMPQDASKQWVMTRDGAVLQVGTITPDGKTVASITGYRAGFDLMFLVTFTDSTRKVIHRASYKQRLAMWQASHGMQQGGQATAGQPPPPSPGKVTNKPGGVDLNTTMSTNHPQVDDVQQRKPMWWFVRVQGEQEERAKRAIN